MILQYIFNVTLKLGSLLINLMVFLLKVYNWVLCYHEIVWMVFVAGRKDSQDVFHSSSQFIQNDIVILIRPNTET